MGVERLLACRCQRLVGLRSESPPNVSIGALLISILQVGHLWWFLWDVWGREMIGGPGFWSKAPDGLCVYSFANLALRTDLLFSGEGSLARHEKPQVFKSVRYDHAVNTPS